MIRRPLLYITPPFVVAIIVSYYSGFPMAAALAFVLAAAVLLCKKADFHKRRVLLLVLAGYCFGAACFWNAGRSAGKLTQYEGQTVHLNCQVLRIEERSAIGLDGAEQAYLQIKAGVKELGGTPVQKKERLLIRYYGGSGTESGSENHSGNANGEKMDQTDSEKNHRGENRSGNNHSKAHRLIPGDTIKISGRLEKPAGRRNPGCFDYALYLKSTGIEMTMTAETLELSEKNAGPTVQGRLYMIKERFLAEMERSAGTETAGLMRAILFGEKTGLEEDTLAEFQKNGTAHVLAVSGLHVGIIYGFLSLLWRWKKGFLFFIAVTAFFLCYMGMASFAPSVVRAVFMVLLHSFAKLTYKRYDLSSAAFLIALLMLVKNPMQLFHIGFQMSFLAVLALCLLLPIVKRFYDGVFSASLAVQIGLMPYLIYAFNYLSLASVLVNVPVIFLAGVIVPAGMCCFFFLAVFPPVFDLVSALVFGLCKLMTAVNAMTGIDGITVFRAASPSLWALALYYLALLFFVSEEGRLMFMRKRKKTAVALAVLVVFCSFAFETVAGNPFKTAEAVFVDVGQGDCIHFRTGDGGNYLVDGGGSIRYDVGGKTLKPYLLKNGVTAVDGAFVTHLHTDHYQGIAELCREGMVKKLFLYEGCHIKEDEICRETGMKKEDLVYLYQGQKVELAEDTQVQVLWPARESKARYEQMAADEADENMSCLVLKICVKGRGILATGDVDNACLDRLAEIWGEEAGSDILKVAHHGSKYSYSEAFAEAASPQYAVFQVGKNNFGHPDQGVIENYIEKGIMIYRNDEDGAVGFDVSTGGRIRALAVRGDKP